MQNLIILGVGVHALEMAEIVDRVNVREPRWRLLGYLSADGKHSGETLNGRPVLGSAEDLNRFPNVCFVPAFGWPASAAVPRERLVSLIDPSCFVSRTARVGLGCVLYPNCYVGLNASIGDYVFCLSACIINHDDVIEDRTTLASNVTLAGHVRVESGCYLGQSCTIKQNRRIGRGSTVGMGAVVVKDVPPSSVVAGNPARPLPHREAGR